ncbi:dihydropteroate synthase [Rubrobacter calidifluminis]|uniref:dihydropteroate synthase n=1 Tax=Rubrobacter calidifluminis TaxID=1392640 RepID=UPI002361D258|nr:dihydropteroate synthase [Rubrobacter calidifluminis]
MISRRFLEGGAGVDGKVGPAPGERVHGEAGRAAIMGILNATPDSFYDRGRYYGLEKGVERARQLVAEGADILDIGGVKAAAGPPLPVEEELRRVVPLVERVREISPVPISIDTFTPEVAREALKRGADIINDTSGLADPRLVEVVAEAGARVVIMHRASPPRVKMPLPRYGDVVREVVEFLRGRIEVALAGGITRENIIVDPGLDFDKSAHHSLELLRRLPEIKALGYPVLLAVSRKDFIGEVLGVPVEERLAGTAAVTALSVAARADIVRVHDVGFMRQVARMAEAIVGAGGDR